MTDKLKKLVDEFNNERELYAIVQKRFLDCVQNLANINDLIYDQCKLEGINMKELNLSEVKK